MAKRSIFPRYSFSFLKEENGLKGDEYAKILQNIDFYCKKYGFLKYAKKTHPECIYTDPESGFY